jgi:hypothetical protein
LQNNWHQAASRVNQSLEIVDGGNGWGALQSRDPVKEEVEETSVLVKNIEPSAARKCRKNNSAKRLVELLNLQVDACSSSSHFQGGLLAWRC